MVNSIVTSLLYIEYFYPSIGIYMYSLFLLKFLLKVSYVHDCMKERIFKKICYCLCKDLGLMLSNLVFLLLCFRENVECCDLNLFSFCISP